MATYQKVDEAAQYLKSKITCEPKYAVVCGSGLGGLGEMVQDKTIVKYSDIPYFGRSTVAGHKGQLVFGKLSGKYVVCMQGRFHPYEGYQPWEISFPIRVMRLIGVELLMVTCAAGGINPIFKVGDVMLIKDHMSFPVMSGYTPLSGPNEEKFGPRFPSLLNAYDRDLRALLRQCCEDLNYGKYIREGVLCNVFGPSFETVAELRMLKMLGGDCVSMSTIPEVITARHAGIKVTGFTLITNECCTEYDDLEKTVCHEEVLEAANQRAKDLQTIVLKFFEVLPVNV